MTEGKQVLRGNAASMRDVMSRPFEWFEQFGELRGKVGAQHIYINRGAAILGVAHLDSVRPFSGFWMNKDYISCSTIDNRLGAWLMLYGLPSLGIEMDVLLTENEEHCNSTARDFEPDREYNWGFSFDRQGDDVVCYEYTGDITRSLLKPYGFDVSYGSYSDISDLDIAAKCMNFGCGMHNYHTDQAYCKIAELALQLKRFLSLYKDHKGERLAHVKDTFEWDENDYDWGRYKGDYVYQSDYHWNPNYPHYTWPAIKRKWQALDKYTARRASDTPMLWFEGEANAHDWRCVHVLCNVNDSEMEDELLEMYVGGSLDECAICENVYCKGDVEFYPSLSRRMCKACFRETVVADTSWRD